MPRESLVNDALLDAIAMVESHNNPHAIGDRNLRHQALGAYQMRYPAFQDVQRIYPQYGTLHFDSLRDNADLQRTMAKAYLTILEQTYGLTNLDQLTQGYNAGPTAVRRGNIPAQAKLYTQKVRQQMRNH